MKTAKSIGPNYQLTKLLKQINYGIKSIPMQFIQHFFTALSSIHPIGSTDSNSSIQIQIQKHYNPTIPTRLLAQVTFQASNNESK